MNVARFTDQKLIFANIRKIKLAPLVYLSSRYTLVNFKLIGGGGMVGGSGYD